MHQFKIGNLQASWNGQTGSSLDERRAPRARYWAACIGPGWQAGNGLAGIGIGKGGGAGGDVSDTGFSATLAASNVIAGPGHDVVRLRGCGDGGEVLVPVGSIIPLGGVECEPIVEAVRASHYLRTCHLYLFTDPCEVPHVAPRRAPTTGYIDENAAVDTLDAFIPYAGRARASVVFRCETAAATYSITGMNWGDTGDVYSVDIATGTLAAGGQVALTVEGDVFDTLELFINAPGGTVFMSWEVTGERNA